MYVVEVSIGYLESVYSERFTLAAAAYTIAEITKDLRTLNYE